MKPQSYSSTMAENGRLGGLAKAAKYEKQWEEERKKRWTKVYTEALNSPALTQAELAKKTATSQPFVASVITPELTLIRLEITLGKRKPPSGEQLEKWRMELDFKAFFEKPRKKQTAL